MTVSGRIKAALKVRLPVGVYTSSICIPQSHDAAQISVLPNLLR